MMEIILKEDIEKNKMDTLLSLLKSWNIDVKIRREKNSEHKVATKFSLAAGIWSDYDIKANELREKAWKRLK